jgi:serine/threonine-protein kinase
MVGPNYGQGTQQLTRVLPANGGVNTPTQPTETKRRNPWTWPLVALISLLAVVLIGTIIALLANPAPVTSPTSPAATSSTPSSPAPSPTSDRVQLNEADIIGLTQAQAGDFLAGLGLRMDPVVGVVAPSQDQVGLAYKVNPKGNVKKNELIAVTFYKEIPAPPVATQPQPVTYPAGPYQPNDSVTISWPTYTGCPSGHTLSGFAVQVTNGTITGNGGNGSVGPNVNSLAIQLGSPSPGTTTINYTALCTDLESPPSGNTSIPF